MSDVPTITALVTFLTTAEGGRSLPPDLNDGGYRPHIVVGPPGTRHAKIDNAGVCRELYEGVRFISGPTNYELGHSATVTLELIYYPTVAYTDCLPDAEFTIREGGSVVGYGKILSRADVTHKTVRTGMPAKDSAE